MAAGSECSSGCQSGWTTYLDDDRSSYSWDDAPSFHAMPPHQQQQKPCYGGCDFSEEEEDDLSMVSDASSGPRQQHSDQGTADAPRGVRRGGGGGSSRMAEPRRQGKVAAAVASTLLEDTASSPAFFMHSSKVRVARMAAPLVPFRYSSCLHGPACVSPCPLTRMRLAICRL